jgi:hypothetical protein
VESSRRQRGHMQRLADVASSFRTTRMLVEQAPARREIQQNGASQHRQRPARVFPSEDERTRLHRSPY